MSISTLMNWTNFVKLLNETNLNIEAAMCTRCKTIIQNFNNQVFDSHRETCPQGNERGQRNGLLRTINFDKMEVDATEETKLTKPDMNKLLTMFFVGCNISFRTVESPFFIRFVEALHSIQFKYKLPTRRTLADSYVNNLYNEVLEKRKKKLEHTPSVLLVDGWKNKSINRKFLVFTLRNINTSQTFLSYVDSSLDSEDGETLANSIDEAVIYAKTHYDTDVYAIITDNDAKIKKGGRLASTSDDQPLWQTTCASHSGNLLLKSLVDKNFAQTVREIVCTFKDSKLEALICNQNGTKLKNYPDTRFCYFRDTCQSILDNMDILERICNDSNCDIPRNVKDTILDTNFVTKLKTTVDNLKPICVLINKCQDPLCSAADAAELWLNLKPNETVDETLLSARLGKAVSSVAYAANILHPEYLGKSLNESTSKLAFDFFEDYLDADTLKELDIFLNSRQSEVQLLLSKCKDPISFWSLCDIYYPHLSPVAIKLMLVPASTAQLESFFSYWSYVHSFHRNRLSATKSSKLADMYYSLRH